MNTKLSRIYLATRRDILNVERAYGLRSIEKHQNDALSVDAWVEELKANGDGNPLLMYKPQGQIFSDTTFNLAKNDFCLAIQTKLQQEMFKKIANSHVVCVNSTHKTNGYDFPLITVLVADEFGERYPVAWCISNREDKVVLIAFFEKLREKCGSIKASWLMTDMAEQYYSAWSTVFAPGTQKLLCTWHVDRA